MIFSPRERKLLDYLIDHPRWHKGLDLVAEGLAPRGTIYIHLGRLEEGGYVESRISDEPSRRYEYRATGKRIPVALESGRLVPA